MPSKKYKVVLVPDERASLRSLISRGKVAAYKRTHAQILLKADESPSGPGLFSSKKGCDLWLTMVNLEGQNYPPQLP